MHAIFRHFIEHGKNDEKRLPYAYWFVNTFPLSEFEGDEALFYHYMDYCVRLESPLKEKYLDVFESTELRKILIEEKIHVPGTESLMYDDPSALESAVRVSGTVLKDNYKAMLTMEEDIDDFFVDMREYMQQKHGERLTSAFSQSFDMFQTSDDSYKSSEFAKQQIAAIDAIYDVDNLKDLTDAPAKQENMYKITEFGLPAIDKDSDGIWSSQLVGIEAQPGTGKTRLALNLVYNAAVLHKRNCIFYTLEQTQKEIEAMLIAKHVFTTFNVVLNDAMIWKDKVPEEYKPHVAAARIDLFESNKYGKIVIKEAELYVESFIDVISSDDHLKGPFDIIVIDYMGLIESSGEAFKREKLLYDIIKSGFRQFKRYVRKTNKAGIAISQFNKEGVEAGQNDKQITTSMAEGGQAVYRNTDYNLAVSMTESMKIQQKRRISQPKVRGSQGFGSIIVETRLGMCYFKQQEQKEV